MESKIANFTLQLDGGKNRKCANLSIMIISQIFTPKSNINGLKNKWT